MAKMGATSWTAIDEVERRSSSGSPRGTGSTPWTTRIPTRGQGMRSEEAAGDGPPRRRSHRRLTRGFAAGLSVSVVLLAYGGSPSSASSRSSRSSTSQSTSHDLSGVAVTGPVPVGSPTFNNTLYGTSFDLSKVGYEKSQFFVSGTAHSYVPAQPLTSDGKWKITAGRQRAIQNADSRLPSDQPEEVQRDGGGRVAQCERRHG